jgi:3-deoxy-manno-octulosonate cytidylyltransferase (CMP-KDO synthetase)
MEYRLVITGIIPARYDSSRLAGKPLADIHGKPMIQLVYEAVRRSRTLDSVLVATDDERIFKAVRGFGGEVAMTDARHTCGTERVAEVADRLAADVIVNIQGDEPLIDPKMIDECVEVLEANADAGLSTLIKRIGEEAYEDRSVVKAIRDLRGRAIYFSRSLIPFPRHRVKEFVVFEHIGVYAYRRDVLLDLSRLPQTPLEKVEGLEQLRALENGIIIQTAETSCTGELVSVDTQADLERVRQILSDGVRA